MMPSNIKAVNEKIIAVLKKHGIIDKKEQQNMIIELINAFTGR